MEHSTYRCEELSIGGRAAEIAHHLLWVHATGVLLPECGMPLAIEDRTALAEGVKRLVRSMPSTR